MDGRRQLRLAYGPNPRLNNAVDYHWNQSRVFHDFGISDHTSVGRAGALVYRAARAYRWAGRVFVVVGAAVDFVSIVQADRHLQRATEVVSVWALGWAGCRALGAAGSAAGSFIEPGFGTVGLGMLGCIVGGYGGYRAGEALGDVVYQGADGTAFRRLPEVAVP